MANIFFGDGGFSAVDGNFNNTNNWYSTLHSQIGCCCFAGNLLGRLPNANTDTIWITNDVTTGPAANTWANGYPGVINLIYDETSPTTGVFALTTGSYSGTITIRVRFGSAAFAITGGTYTGTVIRPATNTVGSPNLGMISGGTYKPTGTISVSGKKFTGTLPTDPGFAAANGTFSLENVTMTGYPDILGAGLL